MTIRASNIAALIGLRVMRTVSFARQAVLSMAFAAIGAAQPSSILPAPTGPSAIGRATYHWIDSTRAAFLDPRAGARREIMVDVWYPVAHNSTGGTEPYLPGLAVIRRSLGDSVARRRFAPEYQLIESGRLTTHATSGGRASCPSGGCPVLIFSHGGGGDRSSYTAQYEDLASHGYVVAAIAHTFDTHLVVFPDGRAVRNMSEPRDSTPDDPALPVWRRELAREARSQAYVRRVLEVEAADIRFVVDRLTAISRDAGSGLRGSLDVTRIGALGHSLGGESAARTCQLDARIKACLNQDGAMHNLPFSRDAAGKTMNQPFMYFTRRWLRPIDPDTFLVVMQMTRAENDSLLNDIESGPTRLLSDMPGGAYRVSLNARGITHMAFSDEPLLQAGDDSAKRADALRTLGVVQTYTRAFFDKTLRGMQATVLERPVSPDSTITVERFPPSAAKKTPP
jgi:predicted dienelactone hydrolase